jgi:hypothetical protein
MRRIVTGVFIVGWHERLCKAPRAAARPIWTPVRNPIAVGFLDTSSVCNSNVAIPRSKPTVLVSASKTIRATVGLSCVCRINHWYSLGGNLNLGM